MNIIVIVADSLRTDHLGCYGSSVKTPNIDALADDAAVFEQAYSENLTTVPCRAAWWTGKYLFAQRGWQPFEHNDILLAERWLEQIIETQKDRLFLWVDSFSPHEPWDPPSPFREMYDPDYTGKALIDPVPGPVEGYMTDPELHHTKCLYAGAVSFMDKWVGVLLDCIRRAGIYDNSLIMLTSDHGAPLGEHGYIRKAGPNCYDELVHIPWIIRHPEGLGKGARIPAFVQPPDLMPTILDAAGIDSENIGGGWPNFEQRGTKLDLTGKSLGPVLSGISDSHRDFAVSAYHGRQWAIRTEAWTYLWNIEGDRPSELYHRKTDPKEVRNLIETRSDVADAMQNRLKDFAEQVA